MILKLPILSISLFIGVFLLLPNHAAAAIIQGYGTMTGPNSIDLSPLYTQFDPSTAITFYDYQGTGGGGAQYAFKGDPSQLPTPPTCANGISNQPCISTAAGTVTINDLFNPSTGSFREFTNLNSSFSTGAGFGQSGSGVASFYFIWRLPGGDDLVVYLERDASNNWSSESPPGLTRIDTVTPPDDPSFSSPYATSTAFDITGDIYVNDDDYLSGMIFRQRIFNNAAAASLAAGPSFSDGGNLLCNAMPAWLCPREQEYVSSIPNSITIEYPISGPGDSSYATTTSILVLGNYTMVSEIIRPSRIFFGFIPGSDSIFVSTTTRFQVVQPSGYDLVVGDTIQAIQDLREDIAPTCSFDFSTPSNYLPQILSCIAAVSQLATQEVVLGLQNAVSDFLSHAPWGYGMLVYQAVQEDSVATTSLPTMSFDFSVVPTVEPLSIDLTPWNYMMCPDSSFASYETPDGRNFLNDVLLHWWNILCWCIWAIAVLVFVFKIEHHHDGDD